MVISLNLVSEWQLILIINIKSLAYAEIRIILARLVWNFELEIDPVSQDWMAEQRQFLLWERGPLKIRLRRRVSRA